MSDELIPILRVRDIASSVAWFERLGYSKEWEHRFEPTFPAFVSMGRGGGARIFLSEHAGDGGPNTLIYLRVTDVEPVAREFNAPIVDQPWAREVHLVDPDGNRVRVGAQRPELPLGVARGTR